MEEVKQQIQMTTREQKFYQRGFKEGTLSIIECLAKSRESTPIKEPLSSSEQELLGKIGELDFDEQLCTFFDSNDKPIIGIVFFRYDENKDAVGNLIAKLINEARMK